MFFQGQVPTQFVKAVDGPAEALFVLHLGCGPLSGKTNCFFEQIGGGRCADEFQHQPSNCPLWFLRPICVRRYSRGARAPWSDRWRDRVGPFLFIFVLDPQPYRGDSYAQQLLIVSPALQQSAPKCSCRPSSSQTLSSICKLSPQGCPEQCKRTTAKRASLANDTS